MTDTNGSHAVAEAPSEQAAIRRQNGQWMPGVSGNPGGRQKRVFTEAGLRIAEEAIAKDVDASLHFMRTLFAQALAGDVQAMRLFIETVQGKPQQAVEHSGAVGGVTKVIFEREVEE